MAYKKYFYRNGKRYGPYYYQSYRDEQGIVRKRYVKPEELKKNYFTPTFFYFALGILALIVIISGMNFSKITGFVVSEDDVVRIETESSSLEISDPSISAQTQNKIMDF